MKISSIDIYKSPIKLSKPFVISLGPLEYAQNVVVAIHTDLGITGWGECSPFMTINGESMDTGFVVGQYLARVLKGKNPLEIENCIAAMDKTIYENRSIKSAFDIALYDIASQNAGLPLYKFLGGQKGKAVKTDYTVSLGNAEQMAKDALDIKERGFEVIKIKLGESADGDINRIKLIREKVGYEIPLRLDANQGWKADEVPAILERLKQYNIQLCEEPIARYDFMKLPEIRRASPIPIMADESCCSSHDAERLLQLYACDMFNIKLGKSGGIFDALKIIEIAEKEQIPIQIGGFLESRLAFTASAHLALKSNLIQFFDFDTPLMFIDDPVEGGITYGKNGEISIPETPGLGAAMKNEYLATLKKTTI